MKVLLIIHQRVVPPTLKTSQFSVLDEMGSRIDELEKSIGDLMERTNEDDNDKDQELAVSAPKDKAEQKPTTKAAKILRGHLPSSQRWLQDSHSRSNRHLVLLVLKLSIVHVLVFVVIPAAGCTFALLRLVNSLADLHGHLLHLRKGSLNLFRVFALRLGTQIGKSSLDLLQRLGIDLVLVLLQGLLRRVQCRVGVILRLNQLLALLVCGGVGLCVSHHFLDLGLRQPATRLDHDVLLLARGFVAGAHVYNSVGVNVEAYLNLRYATWSRRDAHQVKVAQELVVRRHLTLTLQHLDAHLRLRVGSRREHLRLLGRDRRVARDQLSKHPTEGLNAQGQRSHIQQQNVLDVTAQHATLDSSTHGNHLIRVHSLRWLLTKELLHSRLHLGHARHTANQNDLVNFTLLDTSVLYALLARAHGALNELTD
ncbi:hypothetical protein KXD40_009725 [Peronospora effusa]|nr:hypothetical protein KXD40_009725 [Peronospora effusa]